MRFDFEVCFLRFLGLCDVMIKTLAIKIKNHNKLYYKSQGTCGTMPVPYPLRYHT
jgi:hypothetical protein